MPSNSPLELTAQQKNHQKNNVNMPRLHAKFIPRMAPSEMKK